jgi:hypothetical protein
VLLAAGLVMTFDTMLLSGFRMLPTDPGDPRLNNYLLEHSWQWLSYGSHAPEFWNPSMGHPTPNVLAYGDVMVAFGPLYWIWRLCGFSPSTSYQLWLLSVASLNFGLFFLFLRRFFRFDGFAAPFGAFVFAFGLPRTAQIGHAQLFPQIYVVGALWAFCILLRGAPEDRGPVQRRAIAILFACLTAQFYGGFYMGYFLALILAITIPWALVSRPLRQVLVELLRTQWPALGLCAVVSALAVAPLAQHYITAAGQIDARDSSVFLQMSPRLESYLYVSRWSWIYGWVSDTPPFASLPAKEEQALGFGLLTTTTLIFALVRSRRSFAVRMTLLVALTVLVPLTVFPGDHGLSSIVHRAVPGMNAIRAVSRIGIFLLLPASVAVAWLVQRRRAGTRGWITVGLALLCCAEQGVDLPVFDKIARERAVERIVAAIDPAAKAFFYASAARPYIASFAQVDAMLAQQSSGVPTINMYSGNPPRGFHDLYRNFIRGDADRHRIESALADWATSHRLAHEKIQVIYLGPEAGVVRSPEWGGEFVDDPEREAAGGPP